MSLSQLATPFGSGVTSRNGEETTYQDENKLGILQHHPPRQNPVESMTRWETQGVASLRRKTVE